MREQLTADDVCNELCMLRSTFDGVFLVVEGNTDARLYGKFVGNRTHIATANSKSNVRTAVKTMTGARRDGKTVGIVDPDLDRLDGKKAKPPLFFTDCRDMESMIVRSNALDAVIAEYGETEKVKKFEKLHGNIRDSVARAACPVGVLMHVSRKKGLSLNFNNLYFRDFVNSALETDLKSMIRAVIANSGTVKASADELTALLDIEMSALDDVWKAVRGHDAVSVLLIMLKTVGDYNAGNLTEGSLGGALRLAFSLPDFVATDLYRETMKWSADNDAEIWKIVRNPLSRYRPGSP